MISEKQRRQRKSLKVRLLNFIQSSSFKEREETTFNTLAIDLFNYQFTWNNSYSAYCKKLGKIPGTISSWRDTPLMPITAFKFIPVFAGDAEKAPVCYRSSGTTMADARSKHYLWDTELYDASVVNNFKRCVIPDLQKIKIISLVPQEKDMPDSSLSHMIYKVIREFGTEDSSTFIDNNGFLWDSLLDTLAKNQTEQSPLAIIGTLASFSHLFNFLSERGMKFSLPPQSRIMDTGGSKGAVSPKWEKTSQWDWSRKKFYDAAAQFFGISSRQCINEYGMSEMGSQFYDKIFLGEYGYTTGRIIPPWAKTRVVNWKTMEEVKDGEEGVLCFYDLSNLDSALALQTEDIGVLRGNSFELIGRAQGAEAKGCSLSMQEFLSK